MTPNGEPTTEAGRRLLDEPWWSSQFSPDPNFIRGAILAIEAEARATATPERIGDLVIAAERARLRKFRDARATATPGLDARRAGKRVLTFDNGRSETYEAIEVWHEPSGAMWDRILIARDDGTLADRIVAALSASGETE